MEATKGLSPSTSFSPLQAHVIVVGCSIQRLLVPDKQGNLADVVLGCDDIVSYMVCQRRRSDSCSLLYLSLVTRAHLMVCGTTQDGSSPYFGAIVGRCANRISNVGRASFPHFEAFPGSERPQPCLDKMPYV